MTNIRTVHVFVIDIIMKRTIFSMFSSDVENWRLKEKSRDGDTALLRNNRCFMTKQTSGEYLLF